jgi:hypothetical protein
LLEIVEQTRVRRMRRVLAREGPGRGEISGRTETTKKRVKTTSRSELSR